MKYMEESIVRGSVVSDRLVAEGERVFYKTYNRYPLVFTRGEGVFLYDAEGKEYLDFGAGISVMGLGYSNVHVRKALRQQLESGLLHTSNLFYNEPAIEAGRKLLEYSGMDRVFFTNSGTEAVEGALKIARRYQYGRNAEKSEIIAMKGSFHGRSIGALSVTGKEHYRLPFEPLLPAVRFAEYNNLDSVRELVNEHTGAIIAETVQGEGGIYPAEERFLRGLRTLCDEHGMLLILDEIQCGMGRTGYPFAWQEYDIKPDVMTVAKALGNGVPIGAFLARGEAATAMVPGDHGSTYGGNPMVCAAASAVLDVFREADIAGQAKNAGRILWEVLEELRERYPEKIADHRGKGLLQGIEFAEGLSASGIVREALLHQQLVLIPAEHNTIRFVPPLIVEKAQIEDMAERLERAILSMPSPGDM